MRRLELIVAAVLETAPELIAHHGQQEDLFNPQQWGAILSAPNEDGVALYRYLLWRIWDEDKPLLLVIMLNPSTADHLTGDRTADGLMRRARRLGYGGIIIANCFAFRATEPEDMEAAVDPVGPRNNQILQIILDTEGDLLCAWGVKAVHRNREKEVKCAISSGKARPHMLRLCVNGAPEHPLYIPSDLGLSPWQVSL